MPGRKTLNYKVLLIFAPILILIGVLGFILPPQMSITSGETPYNTFHIIFGIIGVALIIFRYENPIRVFNIVFGLLDLYQALASRLDLFPKEFFKWTTTDDILHIVIGIALVIVGLYGFISARTPKTNSHH